MKKKNREEEEEEEGERSYHNKCIGGLVKLIKALQSNKSREEWKATTKGWRSQKLPDTRLYLCAWVRWDTAGEMNVSLGGGRSLQSLKHWLTGMNHDITAQVRRRCVGDEGNSLTLGWTWNRLNELKVDTVNKRFLVLFGVHPLRKIVPNRHTFYSSLSIFKTIKRHFCELLLNIYEDVGFVANQ